MRFRKLATVATVAPLMLLAGCGGDEPPEPPGDFAITVRHIDASVAPPLHAEWTLSVDDDSQGTLDYAPDYPGEDIPTYTAQFDVESSDLADLYEGLSDNDLLREADADAAGDAPIGGASLSAKITSDGETIEIPPFADGKVPLAPVESLIHRLVPRTVWNDFAKRRAAYGERRYGEIS